MGEELGEAHDAGHGARGRRARGCHHRRAMDLDLLSTTLADAGEPAFRAGQVWEWQARGAAGFEAMTEPAGGAARAARRAVPFSTLTVEHEAHAARRDGQGAVPHARRARRSRRCSCATGTGAARCA